jgi:pimeloyl-ACP methyl ester carboxylesterase
MSKHPVIVIPGLQGSTLQNSYQLRPAPLWNAWDALQKQFFGLDFESLALAKGDTDYADHVVSTPHQTVALPYEALVDSLRSRLKVPVYAFRYDWRYSCATSAEQLAEFIEHLQRKPMRSIPDWDGRFDIVCHSFGGLVLRAYLQRVRGLTQDDVNRVVFLAVPHYGAMDALDALVRGQAPIFGGRKELRKLTRTFPSAYELLPRFPGAVTDEEGKEIDIFDVDDWQRNVVYVPDPDGAQQWKVDQAMLDKAEVTMEGMADVLSQGMLTPDQCLTVVGLDPGSTPVSIKVKRSGGPVENWFDFSKVMYGVGDGVVPLISSHIPGVDYVWISNSDASAISFARLISLHAFLPCIDEVHAICERFFSGISGPGLLPLGMQPGQFISGKLP